MTHQHSASASQPDDKAKPDDPTYLNTRREAIVILTAWAVCLVWTVGYCWFAGYGEPAEGQLSLVLGMPAWVFWGVALPWAAALLFSVVYGLWFIADDKLGEVEGEEPAGAAREPAEAEPAAQEGGRG